MVKPVAWITGATSGIGAAFAEHFASQGYDLVLTGRRELQLRELADMLKVKYGSQFRLFLGELSDEAVVSGIESALRNDKNARVLINNAGFAAYGGFHDSDLTIHRRMLTVHCDVTVRLTHAALSPMLAAGDGIIINVASLAGFFPYPNHTMYSATKTFMINFSESLGIRYRQNGLKIMALCPGMTITDFHTRMGLDADKVYKKSGLEKALTAQKVVQKAIRCLNKEKLVCVPGWNNRLLKSCSRLVPRKILYKIMRTWIEKRRNHPDFKIRQ
ncbi:MAG: SDR family NAD(P)-dependent oxidoreductase [Candidatus Marinimicrobia bacterium]|nr:SDR family NAD(P)-dependent oxidoreductase [Candidatus Neomarinimicrobiota bacterium]